jgi:hypothetical protein
VRRQPRKSEPRFVPQEDQIGLDREALEHGAFDIGHVAIEGAVGQHQHPDAIQLALGFQLQQGLLDGLDGEAAVHRVLLQRKRIDVERLPAGDHETVMVRLMAIAVDQDDIARTDQRLLHDLVGGRGSVGDEERAIAPERASRQVLRHFDVAGGLEQAVESASRRRRLGEE